MEEILVEVYIPLDFFEYFIWVTYAFIGFVFLYTYKSFREGPLSRFLIPGVFIKILGGLAFTLVYAYYYAGGDCNYYYYSANQLVKIFYEQPLVYYDLINSNSEEAIKILKEYHYTIHKVQNEESWALTRILSPLNILSFNSYLGLTYLTSMISFFGSFYLFKTIRKIIIGKDKMLFYICFLIPSVTFWGGGVMKDTLTLAALNFIIYLFYGILYEKQKIIWRMVLSIVPVLIIINLKAYIILAFLPWLMFTIFFFYNNKSKNPVAKFLIIPYLGIVVMIFAYFSTKTIFDTSQKYQTENIKGRIEGFRTWHNQLGGSSYDLGEIEYTTTGILSKVPKAINVSLFRPYPWEAGNIMALINSIESQFLLICTLYVFFIVGFRSFFKYVAKSSFLLGGLIFCLFFAFVTGITSYNFGALSRFKIPLMPIYLFILYFIYLSKMNKDNVVLD